MNGSVKLYLTEGCDASAMTAVEYSQRTVQHSVEVASTLAVDTHTQLTSQEMRRMLMVTQ